MISRLVFLGSLNHIETGFRGLQNGFFGFSSGGYREMGAWVRYLSSQKKTQVHVHLFSPILFVICPKAVYPEPLSGYSVQVVLPFGLPGWLLGPQGGEWMDGRTEGQTDGRTKNLPILQDFIPYRGHCPATAQLQPKNYMKRGKGTADHMMPFGNWSYFGIIRNPNK